MVLVHRLGRLCGGIVLTIIEDERQIDKARTQLRQRLEADTTRRDEIRVTYQGGTHSLEGLWFNRPGLWAILSDAEGRWWNAFGLEAPFDEIQFIAAEINVPYQGIHRRVGGAFAED
jgi:hypothetical protein